jgi:hypothetical protein
MARIYRVNGEVVSQKFYLDFQARKHGFSGRREREAARAAARAAGRPLSALPGGRVPVPASQRKAGKWYGIGGSGGRYLKTSGPGRAQQAIRGAARRKSDVYVQVTADHITYTYPRRGAAPTEASTLRIDARQLTEELEGFMSQGQPFDEAIANVIALGPEYGTIEGIRSYEIREYPG